MSNARDSAILILRFQRSVSAVMACRGPMVRQTTRSQSPLFATRSISESIFSTRSASYGNGHNHRLIGEAIRGRRQDVVIHSKSGSLLDGGPDAVRGGRRSALSASNLRAELEKSWNRGARRLLHVARRSESADRGQRRGNGRARQGRARNVSSRSQRARPSR